MSLRDQLLDADEALIARVAQPAVQFASDKGLERSNICTFLLAAFFVSIVLAFIYGGFGWVQAVCVLALGLTTLIQVAYVDITPSRHPGALTGRILWWVVLFVDVFLIQPNVVKYALFIGSDVFMLAQLYIRACDPPKPRRKRETAPAKRLVATT